MKIIKDEFVIILFFLIICVTVFFRFYQLSSIPPSPSLDEVSIGYNAYSILNTGRDEYGYKLPILLRAYDDYRPAGYVYFVIPLIKAIGPSILAERLPSAILSVLDVIILYLLVKVITKQIDKFISTICALIASFLFAISPWHIYISRLGHEANLGLFAVIVGIFFFFLSIYEEKYNWTLIISTFSFALSLYAYQSEKVFSPLFLFFLFVVFFKEIFRNKKIFILSILVSIIISLPAIKATSSPEGLMRLRGTSAFADIKNEYQASAERLLIDKQKGNLLGQLLENRRLVPARIFFANYFSHLKPEWLYTNNGKEPFKAPGFGLFYPWELVLILAGIIFLIMHHNIDRRVGISLGVWIGMSFIAPAITTQSPHAMRSFTLLPTPQIIEAVGVIGIFYSMKRFILRILFITVIIFISVVSVAYFFLQYFYSFPKQQSESYQYALYDSIRYVLANKSHYQKILFSNRDDLLQSYMFYLFEAKYDPKKYLQEGGTKSGGFAEFHKYDSVDFRPIVWDKDRNIQHVLIVGNVNDFLAYAHVVHRGYYLDGKEGVRIVVP